MQYEGDMYRPPSEAHSLLLQVTIGCAWNRCTFCTMYKNKKFRMRKIEDIERDIRECAKYSGRIRRIFLCDGDALVLPQEKLVHILALIQELFPKLESVRAYAAARDILRKTPQELKQLHGLGLEMLYIGLESGDDEILKEVNKGDTSKEMIAAAKRLKEAGIQQSVSIIAGLAGDEEARWRRHMEKTAEVLNQMQPEYLGLLVLMPHGEASLYGMRGESVFKEPSHLQVLSEMTALLENLELDDCFFSSAHASNHNVIKGHPPQDKQRLLAQVAHITEAVAKRQTKRPS